jgi:hypothetical protein
MVKKAGHILIILLLLFVTSGLTINRHFCGNDLIKISIYKSTGNCCDQNCPGCHNEKISLRITDQFESVQAYKDIHAGIKLLLEKSSLPTLLSFSNFQLVSVLNNPFRDYRLKPSPTKRICAGPVAPLLQVFLF